MRAREAPAQNATVLALTDVTVIDPAASDPRRPNQTVVIEAGRITSVGPRDSVRIPASARHVEAAGRYLIPGLWDAHVHFMNAGVTALALLVANGVTSVREMGGFLDSTRAWQARMRAGTLIGPRIVTPGVMLDRRAQGGHSQRGREAGGSRLRGQPGGRARLRGGGRPSTGRHRCRLRPRVPGVQPARGAGLARTGWPNADAGALERDGWSGGVRAAAGQRRPIAAGYVADLVLLDADPLADIANTRRIRAVVQGGRLYDRAMLDSLLTDVRLQTGGR